MKVVINKCHGGFGLSEAGCRRYAELKGIGIPVQIYEIARNEPCLIATVEQLGESADGYYAKLKIVEIPDDVEWKIEEYDGLEWVAEVHRTWE